MILYPYNMVDMGGIDLAEANGTVVEGLYAKIVEAVDACGDAVLYNWKFASIEITPQHTQILVGENSILINSVIQVTELDEVSIIGLDPPVPVGGIVPLEAAENRVYTAVSPVEGFNPVTVAVPFPDQPVLVPLTVTKNGSYDPADYQADGFSSVEVEIIPSGNQATYIRTTSTGGVDAAVSVQEGIYDGSIFAPSGEAVNVVYSEVNPTPRVFDLISIEYSGNWIVKAVVPVIYNGTPYATGATVLTWSYDRIVNFIVEIQN